MNVHSEDQFTGALLGGLFGDMLGAPIEGYKPDEISSLSGRVTDHLPNRYGFGTYTNET